MRSVTQSHYPSPHYQAHLTGPLEKPVLFPFNLIRKVMSVRRRMNPLTPGHLPVLVVFSCACWNTTTRTFQWVPALYRIYLRIGCESLLSCLADVQIVNRYKHYERLNNFEVRVGENKNNLQNPTCSDRVRSVGQGALVTLQCAPPIPGRYVSVQMFGEGILSMCDVMVYSRVGEWQRNFQVPLFYLFFYRMARNVCDFCNFFQWSARISSRK